MELKLSSPLKVGRSHIDEVDNRFGGDQVTHMVLDELHLHRIRNAVLNELQRKITHYTEMSELQQILPLLHSTNVFMYLNTGPVPISDGFSSLKKLLNLCIGAVENG